MQPKAAQPNAQVKPQDSVLNHWVDNLPPWAQALARLSRWDRPVGWRLLFVPCLMGLALAQGLTWLDFALFSTAMLTGAIAMRGAGCTYNDIVDRDIDAKVERTRGRPLPAGQISMRGAWAWLFAQCGIGLAACLVLPLPAIVVAISSIPFVAAYPFMKRITWWPQAWLGVCFSWGALVASATHGAIPIEATFLFAGCVAWTIAYDTIYALQDIEDDVLIGVRSTARLFGDRWRLWTLAFYVIAFALWLVAAVGASAGMVTLFLLCFALAATVLVVMRVDAAKPASALAAFKANVWIGLAVAIAFALKAVL
jgi:4-hydroxybenzoate polyprenyltransferase